MSQIHSVFRVRVYESDIRIRTDGEYAHRKETIEAAASRLDRNKTMAGLISCEVASDILEGIEEALEHQDLSPRIRQEIANTITTRKVRIEVSEVEATVEID